MEEKGLTKIILLAGTKRVFVFKLSFAWDGMQAIVHIINTPPAGR